ncbi:MAG: hypothetical protein WBM68_09145, partial [Woeseia sp.]
MTDTNTASSLALAMDALGLAARAAAPALAMTSGDERNEALALAALEIRSQAKTILDANQQDMDAARAAGLGSAMLDRLRLDDSRV